LSLAVYPEECGNAPVDYKMPAMVAILTACHCLQGGLMGLTTRTLFTQIILLETTCYHSVTLSSTCYQAVTLRASVMKR